MKAVKVEKIVVDGFDVIDVILENDCHFHCWLECGYLYGEW